jgi:hypothetical protein
MPEQKLKTSRMVEGYVRKGGRNLTFQVLDRPPPPPPIPQKNRSSTATSADPNPTRENEKKR